MGIETDEERVAQDVAVVAAWGIGLLLYGAADTSGTEPAASLTAEVDRAEVVSWLLEEK